MKVLLAPILVGLLTITALAVPPEIHSWQQYPTIRVPEAVPLQEVISLSPVWTLDCSLDSEELVGKIVSVVPGNNGRTLLLDSQLVQVMVLSPDGNIESTIGRPGEGPGDLQGAYRAFQLHDGRIGVADGAPAPVVVISRGKIVLLNELGEPAGMWHGAGVPGKAPLSFVRELRCSNDNILVASRYLEMTGTTVSVVSELSVFATPNGDRQVIGRFVFEQEMEEVDFPESALFEPFASGRCDISGSGDIAYAPIRDQWLVVIRDSDGEGLILNRPWPIITRSKLEMEEAQKEYGEKDQRGLCKTKPVIGRIRWRPSGNLWVEALGVDLVPGAFVCFDEFDPKGQLLRRIQVTAPGDRKYDELIIMENGNFGLLRGFKKADASESEETVITEVILLEISG